MSEYRRQAISVLKSFFDGSVRRLAPQRDRIFEEGRIPDQNHGVFNDVLFGTVRRYRSLDAVINTFSDHPMEKLDPVAHEILRLAVYEILFLDGVPEAVSVNEAVELGKRKRSSSTANFVNAILRSVLRSLTEKTWDLPDDPTALGIDFL